MPKIDYRVIIIIFLILFSILRPVLKSDGDSVQLEVQKKIYRLDKDQFLKDTFKFNPPTIGSLSGFNFEIYLTSKNFPEDFTRSRIRNLIINIIGFLIFFPLILIFSNFLIQKNYKKISLLAIFGSFVSIISTILVYIDYYNFSPIVFSQIQANISSPILIDAKLYQLRAFYCFTSFLIFLFCYGYVKKNPSLSSIKN